LISWAKMPTVRGYVDFKTTDLQNTFYNLLNSKRTKCIDNALVEKQNVIVDISTGVTKTIYRVTFYMNFNIQNISDRNQIKLSTTTFKINNNIVDYKFEIWESNNDGIPGQCKPDKIRELLLK